MALKLAQLETFYWVSRLGTFHAAARRLNLTQPTLSMRIKELEQSLGAALFEREGRNVRLTADGKAMLSYAESMMSLADHIESRIGRRTPMRGVLRLGVPNSFAMICLADLLKAIERGHPELEVEVVVDASASLVTRLEAGALDFAVYMDAEVDPRLRVTMLGAQEHVWVAAPELGLPARTLRPGDLLQHRIITNPNPAQLYLNIKRWFAQAALEPARICTCNDLNVILELTLSQVGVSLLPVSIIRAELASGRLRRLNVVPAVPRSIMFAAYRDGGAQDGFEAMVDTVRDLLAEARFLDS